MLIAADNRKKIVTQHPSRFQTALRDIQMTRLREPR